MQKRKRAWLLFAAFLCLVPVAIYLNSLPQHKKPPKPMDAAAKAALDDRAFFEVKLPEVVIPGFGTKHLPQNKEYHYRFKWFEQNIAVWEKALAEFKGKPNVHYLEIGLFEGASAFWMLDNILTHPTSRLTGIDPFLDSFKDSPGVEGFGAIFFSNLKVSGNADRTNIIKGFSQPEMRKLPLESYDIIYIDGSHTAPDVMEDAVLAHRLLKPSGVLIFDDYLWAFDKPPLDRPKPAIDAFYAFYGDQYDVVHNQYQLILRKKKVDSTPADGPATGPTTQP